jgi:hypothetical protein
LRQLLIHQGHPDLVKPAIQQFVEPAELPKEMQNPRENMKLHARVTGFQALDGAQPDSRPIREGLLRQASPPPCTVEVFA